MLEQRNSNEFSVVEALLDANYIGLLPLEELVTVMLRGLYLTSTLNEIAIANRYIITVPTPINKNLEPDLSYLISASKSISSILNKGTSFNTVDIKVFHRPKDGGSILSSNSYNANGTEVEFKFGIQPQNKDSLFVKIGDIIQNQSTYTVDYRLKKVRFNNPPSANSSVNILSVSGNGENVLEADEFIAN